MKLNEVNQEVIDRTPVKKLEEIPLNKPGGFNVCILNDKVTPGMLVIEASMKVIGISKEEAIKRVMVAHTKGWVVIATYAQEDVAETKADMLMKYVKADKSYDWSRKLTGHNGDWPFTVEVMEAGG